MIVENGLVYIDGVTCIGESDEAILVDIDGDEIWFPKSQVITLESEVNHECDEGLLVITEFIAGKKELL